MKTNNIAFIDGQNLFLGTKENNWYLDTQRFRTYLKDKYKVQMAYYFLGYVKEEQQELYTRLQKHGYIVTFREHNPTMMGKKKGNVDTDIVFEIMRTLIEDKDFNKIILVSGDGDYKKTVDYLIKKNKFEKLLPPTDKFSSLYKGKIGINKSYINVLSNHKKNIEYKKSKR